MDGEQSDPTEWRSLLNHHGQIYEELYRTAHCPHVGADLAQETYCRALRALARGVVPRDTLAWLRAIGRNVARDHFRRIRVRATIEQRAIDDYAGTQESDGNEVEMSCGGVGATLAEAMNALSPRARALIVGYYLDGKGCEALGMELGIDRNNVKYHLHRARKRLRNHLGMKSIGGEYVSRS